MKKTIASVIIPNFNGEEVLTDCLKSLLKQTFKNFEVILVDNNSDDNSLNIAQANYPGIRIVKLGKNFGFAKAINEGVKVSQAKYAIFLNNDTHLKSDWLENLIKCAQDHPEVISVNSKLLDFYQKEIIDGVGILINEAGQARSIGYKEKDTGQYDSLNYIFGATGGGSLFRREDFISLGCFDENYFMYFEEVDFAFRAQFLGYKSIYCPKAIVFHKHKATAKKFPSHIEYWQFRNMTQTIIRDFPSPLLFKNFRWLKIILVHLNTIFYQLKKGFFWPPVLTEIWLIFHLPYLLKERKRIQESRSVSNEYIESFFDKKKITFWGIRK